MSARDDAARARSAVPPAAPAAGATQLYLSLFLAVLSFFILLVGTRAAGPTRAHAPADAAVSSPGGAPAIAAVFDPAPTRPPDGPSPRPLPEAIPERLLFEPGGRRVRPGAVDLLDALAIESGRADGLEIVVILGVPLDVDPRDRPAVESALALRAQALSKALALRGAAPGRIAIAARFVSSSVVEFERGSRRPVADGG